MTFSHNDDEENIEKYTNTNKNTVVEDIVYTGLIIMLVVFEWWGFKNITNPIKSGKYNEWGEWFWKLDFILKLAILGISVITIILLGIKANIIK